MLKAARKSPSLASYGLVPFNSTDILQETFSDIIEKHNEKKKIIPLSYVISCINGPGLLFNYMPW